VTKLRVSTALSLPEDTVTSTLIVYGGKGMGKTNFGSVLVEELSRAKLRWSFLDPMGVAWGLRYSADGSGPGIECVILGGPHGDMPIEPTGGAVIADFVVDEEANVLIDFSRKPSGDMWSNGERVRFVTDYTRRLFSRQGQLVNGRRREPLFQILDEAARYIPQVIPAGRSDAFSLADCLGAWEQAVEEGRNIGLGVGLLTQRSARINKSVAELADAMIAFRTVGPNSIEAVTDWLGSHVEKSRIKELTGQVRTLPVGSALVVSPGWLGLEEVVHFRERQTFDSSATPKAGQRAKKVSGPGAKPDLAKYQERMAATIERAKADDPAELRKQILALKKQLAETERALAANAGVSGKEIERLLAEEHQRGYNNGVAAERARLQVAAGRLLRTLEEYSSDIAATAGGLGDIVSKYRDAFQTESTAQVAARDPIAARHPATPRRFEVVKRPAPSRGVGRVAGPEPSDNGHVTGVEQKILNTLRALEDLGISPVDKPTAAALVGYHPNAKSYANALGSLRTAGHVDYPNGGQVALTDTGRARGTSQFSITSLDELHRTWFDRLGNVARRILEPLIAAYPDALDADDVAAAADYHPNAKSFANMKGRLRTLGLVDYPRPGQIAATRVLFPEGLV